METATFNQTKGIDMKDSLPHTSQDHDRKFQHDHITNNPRAAKDLPNAGDSVSTHISAETAEFIAQGRTISNNPSLKPEFTEDKRKSVRHEHTNHFTNRADEGKNNI